MWGFLGEFWSTITQTTINAWEYTVDWFQNIGLAVAGALGGLFDWLLHYLNDLFLFAGWIWHGIATLFTIIIYPFEFIFSFIYAFFNNALAAPVIIDPALSVVSTTTSEILGAIPYWTTLIYILGIAIIAIVGFSLILLILKSL